MISIFQPNSLASHLACSKCGKTYDIHTVQRFADCCNKPLVVVYKIQKGYAPRQLFTNQESMWRYASLLPVFKKEHIVSLGEGMTPIYPLEKMAKKYGYHQVQVKDETNNPTGSFKARGISMAVSKAKELGVEACIVPTAGNAGGALAAYCAKAGMGCTVVMPKHTPLIFKQECELYGANLILVEGLISDCGKKVAELNRDKTFFDVSTLKEPYRIEGKKTMGYEIAEQLSFQLPDVILYPAGGGTGLIGIWKAFREMQRLGWLTGKLPKMMAVQAATCAPIQHTLQSRNQPDLVFEPRATLANGLAVPYPFGMDMMIEVLEQSGGTTVTIIEEELVAGVKEIAATEGIILSPEGAATWKALDHLKKNKIISGEEKILLLNTGSGYKYLDNI